MTERAWYQMPTDAVLRARDATPAGLSPAEAITRLQRFGPNTLREEKRMSPWHILLAQFKNFLILLLIGATGLSLLLGHTLDATVIFSIVIVSALLGFYQEFRAERAMQALKAMASPTASVIRGGEPVEVASAEVVPGHVILLGAGDRVASTPDGLEHSERGIPSSGAGEHRTQLAKRERKLAAHEYGAQWADIEGDGEIAVVTFGSCTGAAREAIARARAEGVNARLVSMRLLAPARPKLLATALEGVDRVLVVEQTHGGQFLRYLRAEFELPGAVRSYRHPGPLPIRPEEVHRQITEWSRA